MKLYEISENYRNIADLLANPEFHDNEDVITALEAVEDDFNNKAVQTVYALRNMESDIDTLSAEIKRLQEMKKVRQNNIDKVKEYLKLNMRKTGIFKIECPLFKISYSERKDSSVEIDEAVFFANITDDSLVKVKMEADKTAIKNALKAGAVIDGARLVDSQVLSIR